MTRKSTDIDQPVQYIKGVGPKKAERLEKLGVKTVGDLLFHFPMRYEDRSKFKTIAELEVGEVAVIKATVKSARAMFRGRGRRMFEVAFADSTGILRANWFSFSSKALTARFAPGGEWIVSGKVSFNKYRGAKTITHPDTEAVSSGDQEESLNFGHITPIYPLTEGLSQKSVRSAAHSALKYLDHLKDIVPTALNRKYKLPSLAISVKRTHWPEEGADIEAFAEFKTREQKKLIFNEFFLIQAGLALKRNKARETFPGSGMKVDESLISKIKKLLPFTLTNAQERVLKEISTDMGADSPMSRLLQGDVGSGKTVIALSAALIAVRNKKQAAIMAPTEILATQHYRNIKKLLIDTNVSVALLTSGSSAKKQAYENIRSGKTHIVVGTHAIIQDAVAFKDLGLAIIDEQHRFGVAQRASLIGKGVATKPHTLIMTATPIPRTLAMTLYGDLDVSVIDELPPGRSSIVTTILQPSNRQSAIGIIRDEVSAGRQAFIVYPLVEESEKLQLKAASVMFEQFKSGEFEGLRLGLTHGRMKSAEKEEVMERFTKKEIDILISTTVIEVGIDQPNATVMMIEHADRFGLSQLHQLRGRVGRSVHRSHCLLMAGTGPGTVAWERLKVMEKSQDGFKIAEADLQLRGSGDFFGVKQSGLPELKIGDILRDHKILSEARKAAFALIANDPDLSKPEHAELRRAMTERWREKFELGEIG